MATDTSKYKLNHSMLRVKDPQKSSTSPTTPLKPSHHHKLTHPHSPVAFYSLLGMTQINTLSFPSNNFTLYFLAYDSPRAMSHSKHWTDREGILELTHNHGSENDANFKTANGNSEPGKGFGHTCISVDNIQAACQKIRDAGYGFQKKLSDGKMRNIAFALDPDGYWVEIIGQKPVEETEGVKETDSQSYRFVSSLEHALKSLSAIVNSMSSPEPVWLGTAFSNMGVWSYYLMKYASSSTKNLLILTPSEPHHDPHKRPFHLPSLLPTNNGHDPPPYRRKRLLKLQPLFPRLPFP